MSPVDPGRERGAEKGYFIPFWGVLETKRVQAWDLRQRSVGKRQREGVHKSLTELGNGWCDT